MQHAIRDGPKLCHDGVLTYIKPSDYDCHPQIAHLALRDERAQDQYLYHSLLGTGEMLDAPDTLVLPLAHTFSYFVTDGVLHTDCYGVPSIDHHGESISYLKTGPGTWERRDPRVECVQEIAELRNHTTPEVLDFCFLYEGNSQDTSPSFMTEQGSI